MRLRFRVCQSAMTGVLLFCSALYGGRLPSRDREYATLPETKWGRVGAPVCGFSVLPLRYAGFNSEARGVSSACGRSA